MNLSRARELPLLRSMATNHAYNLLRRLAVQKSPVRQNLLPYREIYLSPLTTRIDVIRVGVSLWTIDALAADTRD